jgi:predicted RNA-binding protein YlxR (DUF448 family)
VIQQKKQPMRMCNGCGEMKPKRELIRVVKDKDGNISLDKTGKTAGRGAYICRDLECLKKARKSRRIERTFSAKIPDEIYEQLEEDFLKDE